MKVETSSPRPASIRGDGIAGGTAKTSGAEQAAAAMQGGSASGKAELLFGSTVLGDWLSRLRPSTTFALPELGLGGKAQGAVEALRRAAPNLTLHVEDTFVDPKAHRHVYAVRLWGRLEKELGPLPGTRREIGGLPAFVVIDATPEGDVKSVTVRIEPGLALHLLGLLPDPRTTFGRLRLIGRKSLLSAAAVVGKVLLARLGGGRRPATEVPATRFVPDLEVESPSDAVRRHFAAEQAGDVRATLETMSDQQPRKIQVGTGEQLVGRTALYRHYVEVFAAFQGGSFTPTRVIEGAGRSAGSVYVEYRFEGRHTGELGGIPATGKSVSYEAQMVFRVAPDMSISSEESHAGALAILAALGLADDPASSGGLAKLVR